MQNTAFKLIGLKVLGSCAENLRKVLQPDTVYFFSNEFTESADNKIIPKENAAKTPQNFFSLKDCPGDITVNISCIVGKNGDGKSSLIELLIRTLNNFAYLSGFLTDHEDLKLVPGLYTILYYMSDGHICQIRCEGTKASLYIDDNRKFVGEQPLHESTHNKKVLISQYVNHLFYTLVNNYSLYAYNSEEFKHENEASNERDSWISALFHKNDAYQTPIVLTPQRDKGVININKEYKLSIQRLNELFFDCKHGKYKLSENETVEGFAFDIEPESKLFTKTLREYLNDKNAGAQNIIVFSETLQPNKNSLNLHKRTILNHIIEFWESLNQEIYHSQLWKKALNIIKQNDNLSQHTDLAECILCIHLSTMAMKAVENGVNKLTFLQFQRIVLVYEIWQRWQAEKADIISSLFSVDKNSFKTQATQYLIYKTIRIFETYPDFFSNGLREYEIPQNFFNNNVRKNILDYMFKALFDDINSNHTFITLKLRQTLYYLEYSHCKIEPIIDRNNIRARQLGYPYYIDCSDYYDQIAKGETHFADVLPPPIFKGEFLISHSGKSPYPLSRLSSGERQLLNSASSIIYHLRNIARSKESGLKFVYNNANVILEEVELYFHPEYQRRFIHYLLQQLRYVRLPRPLSLNLLFVTHSPFILSDIPKCNVLFLKNGKPDHSMQEDTFGANIHTLLRNGFFLDSVPVGEFAKTKINELFGLLNKSEALTDDEIARLEKEIYFVSEPLLRSQLLKLYSQRKAFGNNDLVSRIEQLEQKIKLLEERKQ